MIHFDDKLEGYYDFIYKHKLYATLIRLNMVNDPHWVQKMFLYDERIKREIR